MSVSCYCISHVELLFSSLFLGLPDRLGWAGLQIVSPPPRERDRGMRWDGNGRKLQKPVFLMAKSSTCVVHCTACSAWWLDSMGFWA